MSTPAQTKANRENAQHSTGPRTEEGKTKSSLNAVKTGLTGRTVLLPGDDIEAYQQHVTGLETHYQPATDAEKLLVQSIADTEWRIARIPTLEAGIYALGRTEFAAQVEHEAPAVRPALLNAKTFLVYQKQLNNLTLQESRLRRQREKDIAELKQLQAEREAARKKRFDAGVNAYYRSMFHNRDFDFSTIGFEFTAEDFHHRSRHLGTLRTQQSERSHRRRRPTRPRLHSRGPGPHLLPGQRIQSRVTAASDMNY